MNAPKFVLGYFEAACGATFDEEKLTRILEQARRKILAAQKAISLAWGFYGEAMSLLFTDGEPALEGLLDFFADLAAVANWRDNSSPNWDEEADFERIDSSLDAAQSDTDELERLLDDALTAVRHAHDKAEAAKK